MNKYQKALNEIGNIVLDKNGDGYYTPKYLRDFYFRQYGTLKKLVHKSYSFEWTPFPPKDEVLGCLDCLIPEIDEEILVSDGKDVWQDRWLISSEDNECDYELNSEMDFEGLAWMPLPKPYKEKENENDIR